MKTSTKSVWTVHTSHCVAKVTRWNYLLVFGIKNSRFHSSLTATWFRGPSHVCPIKESLLHLERSVTRDNPCCDCFTFAPLPVRWWSVVAAVNCTSLDTGLTTAVAGATIPVVTVATAVKRLLVPKVHLWKRLKSELQRKTLLLQPHHSALCCCVHIVFNHQPVSASKCQRHNF